ncbi:MAG: 16S rRNA (guanine(527)-N(7))-methyltransferase RsmG [Methylococcales bacterium]|nr:16S rRNA (guanine(527)-N(7))-methyltransferase RsmG [Methylococcales bacterium]
MEKCRLILQQGLCDLSISADENQVELLLAFIQLIEKWNKAYNLTAIRQREAMASLHILDSLAIIPFVEGHRVADIGTGAGIPGIPLAIFLPDVQFTLVDSNSKKTRFVQQAVIELKLDNVKVIHSRVENIHTEQPFSSVMMRAFSSLQDIIGLTGHLVAKNGIILAMKGLSDREALDKFAENYKIIPLNVPGVEAERCLIRVEGIHNHG